MAKIRFSRKAIADLDGIWEYTADSFFCHKMKKEAGSWKPY
jgi:plasmid stabilization system protein ParE